MTNFSCVPASKAHREELDFMLFILEVRIIFTVMLLCKNKQLFNAIKYISISISKTVYLLGALINSC
jgi:hypothetical protein